jgi:arylsulfatase A-like enzyme
MMDTLRPDYLGCYGNKWIKTPNLDRFARESMVFDRSVAEALPTIQVRRAMFTGQRVFPFTRDVFGTEAEASSAGATFLGVSNMPIPGWAPIPLFQVTLSEMMQGIAFLWSGEEETIPAYRTALITDTYPYFSFPGMNFYRGFGHWDYIRGQQGDHYGVPVSAKKWDMDRFMPPWFKTTWEAHELVGYLANAAKRQGEEDYFAPRVFRSAVDWLQESREAEDPFFLCVDCWDPHEPWDPPQPYVDLYDAGYQGLEMIAPYYGPTAWMSEKELNHMRMLYAGEVTLVDTWFGKFMGKVRELGLLDNTLIIVTSDHGHLLGEHGVAGKLSAAMYNELINSVLMIRHPEGIGAGQRSDALVQHHDICTTIVNFSGVRPPYDLEGRDLMPVVEGRSDKVRDYATCGFGLSVWCRTDEHVLICGKDGDEPQLFDMKNDPEQRESIAPSRPDVVKRLYDLILADANGGPILPNWKVDPMLLKIPAVKAATSWHGWSPFREWRMPGDPA